MTLFAADVVDVALDTVQLVDHIQRDIDPSVFSFGLHFLRLHKLKSKMRPAADTVTAEHFLEAVYTEAGEKSWCQNLIRTLEPKAKTVALPVKILHPVVRLVEKHKKYRAKHFNLDIQLDQDGQTVGGFTEAHWLGVEVDFSTFASGRIMRDWLLKDIGSTASDFKWRY